MQECTPEIITKSAKTAGLYIEKISSDNYAYLISNASRTKSFVASSWSLYPNQQNWHASIMRYKELSSHYLNMGNFVTIPGTYIYTPNLSLSELHKAVIDYTKEIGFPVVIKPNTGSLSRDIYMPMNETELKETLPYVKENIDEIIVQRYINQSEYRIFIHKGVILYLYKKQFVLNDGETDRLSESPLNKDHMMKSDFPPYLEEFAEKLYKYTHADVIGADVFLKSDIFVDQEPTIIELNHNPGLGVMYRTYSQEDFVINFLSRVYKDYLKE